MRNKWLMSILILLLALPFFGSNVVAETATELKDGTYEEINYDVLHEVKNEKSRASGYFSETATLTVENGKQTIQLEISSSIKSLKVNGIEVDNISENEVKNTKHVEFVVNGDLAEFLNMEMHVLIPEVHEDNYKTRALFEISEIPTKAIDVEEPTEPVEKPTEPEEPVKPEEPTEPTEPEQPVQDDGDEIDNRNPALVPDEAYKINFISTSKAVNGSFNNPAVLLIKDGEKYIQITAGTRGNSIELLAINDVQVTFGERHSDGPFTFQFKLDAPLEKELDFYMEINAGPMGLMKHNVDLAFDAGTQEVADIADYTLLAESNESEEEVPTEGDDPVIEENPIIEDDPAVKVGNEKPIDEEETTDKIDPLAPDKAYEIDLVFKQEKVDETSVANNFFIKSAILLEKDGDRYLQITATATGSEFIKSLKNKFGEFVVVKVNADGSVVYQFKIDGSLSEAILLDMIIDVPGIYENQEHKVRLFLDVDSMKELNANDYRLVASNNENGPTVEGEPVDNNPLPGTQNNTPKTNNTNTNIDPKIEKPKLDSNEKNESTNKTKVTGQEKNPQTGDTTNIMLYVLLLIGSAIPLAIQLKRRFTTVE